MLIKVTLGCVSGMKEDQGSLGKLFASDISATDQQLLETASDTAAGPADWAGTHKRRVGALPGISGP